MSCPVIAIILRFTFYIDCFEEANAVMNHDIAACHVQVKAMSTDNNQSAVFALSLPTILSISVADLQQGLQSCRSAMTLSYMCYCLKLDTPFLRGLEDATSHES